MRSTAPTDPWTALIDGAPDVAQDVPRRGRAGGSDGARSPPRGRPPGGDSPDAAPDAPAAPPPGAPRRRAPWIALAVFTALVVALGLCESLGWPFLAGPMQRALAQTLERRVAFAPDPATPSPLRLHLLGRVRIDAAYVEIGAPAWSSAPHLLLARDAQLTLGYGDLWRAHRGEPLRIRALRAAQIDGHVERLADGRASWQFGPAPAPTDAPLRAPVFDSLRIGAGTLVLRDDVLGTDLAARFALTDRSADAGAAPDTTPTPSASDASSKARATSAPASGPAAATTRSPIVVARDGRPAEFRFDATGHYRKQPLQIEFASNGVLSVVGDDARSIAWPVRLSARIGRAGLSFRGTATDPLNLGALQGRFDVHGPSLAAIGDPLGVTLPTTGAFKASGAIAKQGQLWNTVVDQAVVGSSSLSGAFAFDAGRSVPQLAGRLRGSRLLLADLGPAVGAGPRPDAPGKTGADATSALPGRADAASAPRASPPAAGARPPGRVLPDRPFDLPSLRTMDANVLVDIDSLDLGSSLIEPLRPLRTHLVLQGGVLTLREIDARTAQGSLRGTVQLDGRAPQALWTADLNWRDVRLERWLHQARSERDAPPYLTGRLNGQAQVRGQGASTAAILGTLRGTVRAQIVDGSVSHLAVEAAGLDLAQALGVLVKGDDALPIDCSVVDLAAEQGMLRPRVLVLDTRDSTVWVDGSLSLASEALDLRLFVSPKDFSPLALRTPVRVRGTFADPSVSIEKKPLVARVGAAALLALVNPLAAVLPFFDGGNDGDAQRGAQACRTLAARAAR